MDTSSFYCRSISIEMNYKISLLLAFAVIFNFEEAAAGKNVMS